MDTTLDAHRRKLVFRAWRRGFREMDLLMGGFADVHMSTLEEESVAEFERLLSIPDWEVYAWIIGQKPVPPNHAGPVLDRLIAYRFVAQPG